MPNRRDADVGELLRRLVDAEVEFIVVGGAAAVLHGAPITTEDVDIVHRRTIENVARLKGVLDELDAHVLLSTRLGPLDCLGTLVDGRGFEELVLHSESLEEEGAKIRVADLPALIDIKSKTGRDQDRPMLPVLVALAEELEG